MPYKPIYIFNYIDIPIYPHPYYNTTQYYIIIYNLDLVHLGQNLIASFISLALRVFLALIQPIWFS